MRNKGFFWFLTILLTVICVYQLSFTFVSNSVENDAEAQAKIEVRDLKASAIANNNGKAVLPNSLKEVDFINDPQAEEVAIADHINMILKLKASKPVYPIFGSTFKEVKSRSLALGLDLVGGMSVTMEISIPDLVKNYIRNEKDLKFKLPYEAAKEESKDGKNFIENYVAQHKKMNPKVKLVSLMSYSEIKELNRNSSDDDVLDFLLEKQATSMDDVEEIMNLRINQFGVAQPNIQKDPKNNRIYIELPGVQDDATVTDRLSSTANLEFFETHRLADVGSLVDQAHRMSLTPETDDFDINDQVVDSNDVVDGDSLTTPGADMKLGDGLGMDGFQGLNSVIQPSSESTYFVKLKDKGTVDQILRKRKDVKSIMDQASLAFMWGASTVEFGEKNEIGYQIYAIKVPLDGKAKVGGKDVREASTGFNTDDNKVTVDVVMSEEGDAKWAQMTRANIEHMVAITMDGVVYSAPNVNDEITGGKTEISGSFTIEEANELSGLLNGGALPAPLNVIEQTKVGPTIGKDNSRAGLMSFGFALLLVFAYMIFYYGKAGVVADIALFANILFIFGSLASFGAVLTLAGIAGIVLTIGMAVDANVLIFERIREEQATGKDLKSSIDTGFKKALTSIIDANVTTLLTAIVLKSFGSGPIESFATTLIIGIFTSVFAALVITRLCIGWWMSKGKSINFESKMTKGAFKSFKFDFVGKRKSFYIISAILVVGSIASLFGRGLSQSVEFTGGHMYTVEFDKSTEGKVESIKGNLETILVKDGKTASTSIKTKNTSFFLEITTNYEKDSTTAYVANKIEEGLALSNADVGGFKVVESRSVSKQVSGELMQSSMLAILLSLLIVFGYILMRFGKWQYSTGAIIAMAHDVLIVLGIFAAFHGILPFKMDIDQAFIAAILTVIGYSINDTVVVFDRIRENLRLHKNSDEKAQINKSLNSTLSRTINTSMTTFIVLLIIFLFGGDAIKGFIFALMIGVIVGTYSSMCIATPVLIDFSKKSKKGLHEPEPEVAEVIEA